MKLILASVLAASALLAPALASADEASQPVTRASVVADLVQFERAGYVPSRGEDTSYPADVQASAMQTSTYSGDAVGGMRDGSASTGRAMTTGHTAPCVGPTSFCTLYFGS